MRASRKKLERILNYRRSPQMWLLDNYLKRPILYDILMSLLLLCFNFQISKVKPIIKYNKDGLSDLLNELISTSMSLGGFVLASMAIIASMKDNTNTQRNNEATNGREFFFNSSAYNLLIKSFSWSCIFYVIIFLYFSIIRSIAEDIDCNSLFNYTYFGLLTSAFTLMRCIYLIQATVKIK